MTKFELFLSQLSETNATLAYFTNFEKVTKNINKIALKLNQLNYLIGKEDLYLAICELFDENPKSFEILDILIAVRKSKKTKVLAENGKIVPLDCYFSDPDKIFFYFKETGLEKLFKNKKITNLVDYVFGIEVGLDSNARKNRGGDNMVDAVKQIFEAYDIKFDTEVNHTVFPQIISLGDDVKRFDFVIRMQKKTYLIETNFYNSGGSKLNEVARAYSDIAPKINQYPDYEFVWITDGQGWLSAKNKLQEALNIIPSVYNLATLPDFIKRITSDIEPQ